MSFLINGGISEGDLPVKSPSGASNIRYVEGGKSYSSPMPDIVTATEQMQAAIDGIVADAEQQVSDLMNSLGYLPPVAFASGLLVDSVRVTVSYSGVTYAPAADALPFATTGTFNPAQWRVVQGDFNLRSDLADPADGAGLVAFRQAGYAEERSVNSKLRELVSVLDYIPTQEHAAIAAGTSSFDCTASVNKAFAVGRRVKFPAGRYNVTGFDVSGGRVLDTDGLATVIQQIAGQPVGTRIIRVTGSNVEIGSMTCRGNISTDTDEQQHAIFIQANANTGSMDNIKIGDIRGENIRGDVVYFGQATGGTYKLTNVHIGHITFDNIFRNGVSCVSCDGFTIESVTGTRCGFTHMDVEANVGSGPCVNGRIGYIKGRTFGLVSPSASDYIDNIEIGVLDLSPSHTAQSSPQYAAGASVEDGLLLRNIRRAKIGQFKAEGFNRCAAFVTYSAGELGCEDLEIGSVYLRNCSITDSVYNSYIQWPNLPGNKLRLGHMDVVVNVANKRVIDGMRSGYLSSIYADVQASSALLRNCNDVQIGNVVQVGTGGFMLHNCNRVSVKSGSFAGDRLATGSTKCSFENFTATASVFLFSSGQEDHFVANCSLNGEYYSFGTAIRSHLNTMRFGAYSMWVDSTGKLRIKGGVPTSDADGVVVGTQT